MCRSYVWRDLARDVISDDAHAFFCASRCERDVRRVSDECVCVDVSVGSISVYAREASGRSSEP